MSQKRLRVGVMGGTFDPIHNGHLVAASEVAARFALDEVVFVPTGAPTFKQNQKVSQAEHRYLMTVIATASNPQFTVSRVDIDRVGLTYTVDTLRDLHKERPDDEFFFITGADAIKQILSWKDAEELFVMAKFVAVTMLEIPAMAISSTDCRERARAGLPVWYLVPDGVVQFISKHQLYQDETTKVQS